MHTNVTNRWLAGLPAAPLVPISWVSGLDWKATVHEVNSQGRNSSRVVSAVEAAMWPASTRTKRSLDVGGSAPNIVRAIANSQPEWLEESLFSFVRGDVFVGDLPLLIETRNSLAKLNFGPTAAVEALSEVPRRELFSVPGGEAALLDLTVAIEAWWPHREQDPVWNVMGSRSLEHVARAIATNYLWLLGGTLDDFWIDAVLARQSWGVPKATLEVIGSQIGVTRERARQILARFDRLVGQRVWPIPNLLAEVIESTIEADPGRVPQVVLAAGFAEDEDWTAEELAALLVWFGRQDIAAALLTAWEQNEASAQKRLANIKHVRAQRSALGFLNAAGVFDDENRRIPEEEVVELVTQAYSRVYREGSWILAGQRGRTMAEGTVARQLWANQFQSQEEIVDGLERRRTQRQAPQLPPSDVIMALLEKSGAIWRSGNNWTGESVPAESGSIESWLVHNLNAAEGGVLHRDVLLRRGPEDGLNVVSLHQYISYSPVVRTWKNTALIRLAGREVDPDSADLALRVAEALWKPTDVQWRQLDSARLEVIIQVGTGLFSSSIINVEAALAGLWPAEGADINCICDRDFDGRIRRYGSGNQLIGWMTLLAHLNQEHGFREGDSLTVKVDGDRMRIVEFN